VKWALEVDPGALKTTVEHTDDGHVGLVIWRGDVIAKTDPMDDAGDAKAAADAAIARPCDEPDDHADAEEDGENDASYQPR
jgi:hypothetical protein